jgi:hypothetical protein
MAGEVTRASDLPELLRVSEVAAALGLSVSATKRIPADELPYLRVARRGDRRYTLDAVRAYREARRVDGR